MSFSFSWRRSLEVNKWILAFGVLSALVCSPASAHSETIELLPTSDATLFEDPEGAKASGAGPTLFLGDNRLSTTRRALLRFEVAAELPPDAVVQSVSLWLYVSDAPNETAQPVTVHRVLESWGEGPSASSGGGGAPAEPGDATWLHRFYPGDPWSEVGGSFDPTVAASIQMGISGWQEFAAEGLVQDVQGWLDDPSSNFGWMLRGAEGTPSSSRGLHSRESETAELRPYLHIEYRVGDVSSAVMSISRLKSGY